ncbi:MAG: hypothetical protein WD005_05555, partial [Haliea sp.]
DGGYLGHFDFELNLADDEMDYPLGQIISTPERHEGLEVLCEQLTNAAWSGLNWLSLVDKTSKKRDLTGYSIPSISPHDQNEYVKEFGKLVFLLRAAFDRRLAIDVVGAVAVARQWSHLNFPLFMRLFLYAANRCGNDLDQRALRLLTRENGRWLWALDTTREVNVYLRERVQHWPQADTARLCRVVLAGPERGNYRSMPTNEWRKVRDQIVSKYLKKLEQGGVALPAPAIKRLAKLRAKFPYALPDDHNDEFVIYSGPVRDAEWGDGSELEPAAFREFSQRTPAERVAAWRPEQSSVLRKLLAERPLDALETLEEGLARDLQDSQFWSEGISGLAVVFETFASKAGEASDGGE